MNGQRIALPITTGEAKDSARRNGPTMGAGVLLLLDGRFPAGGYAHSGGAEMAVARGEVTDVGTLDSFLSGRLRSAGVVAACLAAAAAAMLDPDQVPAEAVIALVALEQHADARTAAPAARRASRLQGRMLLRAVEAILSSPALGAALALPEGVHHPVALGAAVAAAGGTPADAALGAASGAVLQPALAAQKLLGLDPRAVTALLAALAPSIDAVALAAADLASSLDGTTECLELLPAPAGPALDLLAEEHRTLEVRLFAS